MRQWAKTALAVAASLVALGAAGAVHYLYTVERFAEIADGQWVANQYGYEWRLDSWTASPVWDDAFVEPAPGSTYILVTVSVRLASRDLDPEYNCSARLVGSNDTEWRYDSGLKSDSPSGLCEQARTAGQTVTGVLHYEVPQVWATPNWIRGIAFDHTMGFAPTPLLTTANEG